MGSQQNIEARLCAFVEGELDGPERAEIEQFLAQNPQQRQLVNELIQARAILRDLPGVSPPPEIAEAFGRHLERAALLGDPGPQERYRLSVNRWRRIRAAAAILILAGGLAALVAIVLPHSGPRTFSSSTPGLGGSGQQTPGGTQLATESPAKLPESAQSQSEQARPAAGIAAQQTPPGPVADAQLDRSKATYQLSGSVQAGKDETGGGEADTAKALPIASDDGPGTLQAVRDVALAADAVHTTMRQRSEQPSDGGAIYVVLRGSDAAAQARRVQSRLEAASIAWTDVPATNLGYANSAPALANVAPATQAAVLMNDRTESASAKQLTMTGRPASQPAGPENQEESINQTYGAGNTAAGSNNNNANGAAATYSMNELPKQPSTQATANAPTTIIWAHDVHRSSAQAVASELAELASPGVVGADVIPALMPVDTAAAGKAPSTGPAVSLAQSTTQSASELLAVGQSVTLIARDPMVNNSEVYHETQQIDTEGNVTVPAVGRVRAAGLAASDLQQNINRAYGTGQQAANVDWQVMTQTPAPTPTPTPAMMPTSPAAEQGGAIAGGPTTQTAEPATMPVATTVPAREPSAAGPAAAVDLVIVIRQSGQAPGNNPPSSQPVSTGETESGTPASPMPTSMPAPAAPQAEQPALPPSPAATEPSDVGPAPSQRSAEPSSVPPATGPTN
jgi:polysaccharide biosynthesis/export protein